MCCLCQQGVFHGRDGYLLPILFMCVELFLFRGTLNIVNTSFSDSTFTGLIFKRSRINFNTKGGLYWLTPPVNPITNSSILKFQIIATNYCYQLLLQMFTEERNCIVPGFG